MRFLESRETAYNLRDSENKLNVPLQTIIKMTLSIVAPIFGTVSYQWLKGSRVLRQFKRVLKRDVLARHSWKAAFLLNKFNILDIKN